MSSWLGSRLAATVNAASELAQQAGDLAAEKAADLKKTIEDELSTEYERTTARESEPALRAPPPPQTLEPTVLERMTKVGVALLSPLDDGTSVGSAEPERVQALSRPKPHEWRCTALTDGIVRWPIVRVGRW
jgi:hypothetical protein